VSNLYYPRKGSAKDRLNPKKNRSLSESRDLDVINVKIWVLLCKIVKYEGNFQIYLGPKCKNASHHDIT
jgi:hypothetical protein